MRHLLSINFFVAILTAPSISLAQDNANSRIYKRDYPVVWKALLQAVTEGGDSISNQDKESGTLSTEWFTLQESVSVFSRGWKVKENILVEKESSGVRVTLNLLYQNKIGKSEWRPASNNNDYTPKIYEAFFALLDKRLK